MQIYNTLTRTKEDFNPIEPGKVRMYVCGPTVYDNIHIGNARPNVIYDSFRRYLEYRGYEVNFVQNFTDVDDKIINRANEQGMDPNDYAEKFIEEIKKDTQGLGIKEATHHPRATEEIDGMIDMIQVLIDKGYAYAKDGNVYYRTKKFEGYGKLSKKNIEDLEAGSRIQINEEKEDPMDFVLWKARKEGEPGWETPWGTGRPGWHIECSAMAKAYLGDTIDIHAGGEDLTFPHHENEIAQSEAANEAPFAKYWMHNGFINVDNKKMSKSLGNFFTVRDIVEHFDYEVIRFFILSAHYRSPINFSKELMESAKNGLDRIKTGATTLNHYLEHAKSGVVTDEQEAVIVGFKDKFVRVMDDDFNSADGITTIFELVKYINTELSSESATELLEKVKDLLTSLCDILGINVVAEAVLLDEDIEALIQQRQDARKNKDFALSDKIRDDLLEQGIVLEDTREGVRFKRV